MRRIALSTPHSLLSAHDGACPQRLALSAGRERNTSRLARLNLEGPAELEVRAIPALLLAYRVEDLKPGLKWARISIWRTIDRGNLSRDLL